MGAVGVVRGSEQARDAPAVRLAADDETVARRTGRERRRSIGLDRGLGLLDRDVDRRRIDGTLGQPVDPRLHRSRRPGSAMGEDDAHRSQAYPSVPPEVARDVLIVAAHGTSHAHRPPLACRSAGARPRIGRPDPHRGPDHRGRGRGRPRGEPRRRMRGPGSSSGRCASG